MVAGPVFTLAWIAEGSARTDGYDWRLHPISSLALGERGWMQAGAFWVTGLLTAAYALGLARVGPVSSRWTVRFLAAAGLGLIGAGFFPTEASR